MKKNILIFLFVGFSCKETLDINPNNSDYKNAEELKIINPSSDDIKPLNKIPAEFIHMLTEICVDNQFIDFENPKPKILDERLLQGLQVPDERIRNLMNLSKRFEEARAEFPTLYSPYTKKFGRSIIHHFNPESRIARIYYLLILKSIEPEEKQRHSQEIIRSTFNDYTEEALQILTEISTEDEILKAALLEAIEFIKDARKINYLNDSEGLKNFLRFSVEPFNNLDYDVNGKIIFPILSHGEDDLNKLNSYFREKKLGQYLKILNKKSAYLNNSVLDRIEDLIIEMQKNIKGKKGENGIRGLRKKFNEGRINQISEEDWKEWQESKEDTKEELNRFLLTEFPDDDSNN